ncbi:MAG TPA: hypothetical protein VMI72_07830, partial [Roseiarcus sp.]|nr:hypothetical protein [Roseiarcus sp.]
MPDSEARCATRREKSGLKAIDELLAGEISPSAVGTVVAEAAANTVHAIQTLFGLGARNLMFYEVPD